jgi:hypothetical protein
MAGTGKSTIARSVARRCHDEGFLGASFFFSGSYTDTPISSPDTPSFSPDTPRNVPPCTTTIEQLMHRSFLPHAALQT